MRLTDLDRAVVPRAAVWLRRQLDGLASRRSSLSLGISRARGALVSPGERRGTLAALGRLDDRYATRGPLRVVRDVPQIGLFVAAAVFAAGAGVALAHSEAHGPDQIEVAAPAPLSALLGPMVGMSVDSYITETRSRAAMLSSQSPDGRYLALVSFAGYFTPRQVRALMGPLLIERAYLRAPNTGLAPEILPVPVKDFLPDLRRAYGALATRKGVEQREFRKLARSIVATTREEATFKAFYLAAAVTAGKEAAAYRAGCPCVFEAIVSGPARLLAQLPSLQGVRAVEFAARGAEATTLRVLPLLPETRGIVKPPRSVVGGNGA